MEQEKNELQQKWSAAIGAPENYQFEEKVELIKKYDFGDLEAELYHQNNGPGTFQRVLLALPKNRVEPLPAVAVPFYFPEAMLGFELETREKLPKYAGIEMLVHLVKRGYICATADAYHLTLIPSSLERGNTRRWHNAGAELARTQPDWSGVGKLVEDTRLMVDLLCNDPRIDAERVGIAGHSLGGKMAYYTGCLDKRIKVILASDFGLNWDQTNYQDIWYWGEKVKKMQENGLENWQLLGFTGGKPLCLLAGECDDLSSYHAMLKASGYPLNEYRRVIYNHGTGHRPPADVLEKGYDFLDFWLKNKRK